MIPQFLDLEKLTASHRHGMLRLTLPLKESVKPRRVQIETEVEEHKQLVGAEPGKSRGQRRASSSRGFVASDTSSRRRLRCLPHGTLDGLSPQPVEASAVATISRHVQPTARHPRSEMLCPFDYVSPAAPTYRSRGTHRER